MRFARGKSRSKAKRESSEEKSSTHTEVLHTNGGYGIEKTGHALLLIYLIYKD